MASASHSRLLVLHPSLLVHGRPTAHRRSTEEEWPVEESKGAVSRESRLLFRIADWLRGSGLGLACASSPWAPPTPQPRQVCARLRLPEQGRASLWRSQVGAREGGGGRAGGTEGGRTGSGHIHRLRNLRAAGSTALRQTGSGRPECARQKLTLFLSSGFSLPRERTAFRKEVHSRWPGVDVQVGSKNAKQSRVSAPSGIPCRREAFTHGGNGKVTMDLVDRPQVGAEQLRAPEKLLPTRTAGCCEHPAAATGELRTRRSLSPNAQERTSS